MWCVLESCTCFKSPCCAASGYLGNESMPAVVASMTVQMCSAADLGPALGTMLTRLFPHIFRVRPRRI